MNAIKSGRIDIVERWPLTIIEISTIPGVPLERAAIETRLGVALPGPNEASEGRVTILSSGPQRWLAVGDREKYAGLAEELARVSAATAAIVDLSDARGVIRMTGPGASTLLATVCAVDFDLAGDVAVTGIARISGLVHVIVKESEFDLYVHRSYAKYLWELISLHVCGL